MIFVAPLPPPVHGFSVISRLMLDAAQKRGVVASINTSPNGALGALTSIARFAKNCVSRRHKAVYIAVSGGRRQILDCVYAALARFFGLSIFLHHHSFAYINSDSHLASLLFRIAGPATHIVLCACMQRSLSQRYALRGAHFEVISNSAFTAASSRSRTPSDKVRIGLLSNLSIEKGLFDFVEVYKLLRRSHPDVEAWVAGPLEPTIDSEFKIVAANLGIRFFGALMSAEEKEYFFSGLRYFVFPTRYRNEAEPVVVLEALSFGVPVIAYGRGCIGDILDGRTLAGTVIDEKQGVDAIYRELARRLNAHDPIEAQERFRQMKSHGVERLNHLLTRMVV